MAGFSLVLVAALTLLSQLIHDPQENLAGDVLGLGTAVPFAVVGFVVARKQPKNPIGWVLMASAVC
ncbi:MAG: hypothetical protein WB020_04650, partial [Candidatus Dormiibacterota bacterium]